MPGPAFTSNTRTGTSSDQNLINRRYTLCGLACSHVHARYPQSLPQFPGASENAQSRAIQGFARETESFLLDPEAAVVPEMAFCTTDRSAQ
jgi:hypothetical protein